MPRLLQVAGYVTAHIGKWHLGGGRDVTDAPVFAAYGYDFGLGTYESPEPAAPLGSKTTPWSGVRELQQVARDERTRWMVDETLGFLKKSGGKPCFVNLWLDDTHTPWVPAGAAPGKDAGRENLAAVIRELDAQMGRLMDGVPANTLLIFATDNGPLPTFGGERNAGLRGSKLSLYEGGTRLPFIARWPGRIPAARVDETSVAAAVDMLPTLAAIAGTRLPADYAGDGEDMSAALCGKPFTRSKPLFWEYGRNEKSFAFPRAPDRSPGLALREGKWKLLINADGTGGELYDPAADPGESRNLAATEARVVARLRDTLLAWQRSWPVSDD